MPVHYRVTSGQRRNHGSVPRIRKGFATPEHVSAAFRAHAGERPSAHSGWIVGTATALLIAGAAATAYFGQEDERAAQPYIPVVHAPR